MNKIYLDDESEDEKKAGKPDVFAQEFLKTRQILLSGEINKESAENFNKQLLIMESNNRELPVYVYIDSPGGDVSAGFAIYDMIRFVSCPVILIGNGLIASAAALILLSVPKERRFSLPNSHFLIHQPLMGGSRGVATDIEITAQEISKSRENLTKLIAEATGKDFETVKKDTERDHWLTAQEAADYGIVGTIISSRKELPEA